MTTPQLEHLNTQAAKFRAAIETTDRALAAHQRLTLEVEREREAYARTERDRDAAIERSIHDSTVTIPRLDRTSLDVSERKFQAADRALHAARANETPLAEDLQKAETALYVGVALERAAELQKAVLAIKALPALCALQGSDEVRAALHGAGFHISRDVNGGVTISLPKPADIPKSVVEAALLSVNPKSAPAAMTYLQSRKPSAREAATKATCERRLEINQDEKQALRAADEWFHALKPALVHKHQAEYEARIAKIKADAAFARAAARV
jgi:hypothetical protein